MLVPGSRTAMTVCEGFEARVLRELEMLRCVVIGFVCSPLRLLAFPAPGGEASAYCRICRRYQIFRSTLRNGRHQPKQQSGKEKNNSCIGSDAHILPRSALSNILPLRANGWKAKDPAWRGTVGRKPCDESRSALAGERSSFNMCFLESARKATTIASSSIDNIVDVGCLGPVGRSATERRFFHLATVFGLIPWRRARVLRLS
jgi:hypothetical protein